MVGHQLHMNKLVSGTYNFFFWSCRVNLEIAVVIYQFKVNKKKRFKSTRYLSAHMQQIQLVLIICWKPFRNIDKKCLNLLYIFFTAPFATISYHWNTWYITLSLNIFCLNMQMLILILFERFFYFPKRIDEK